MKDWKTSTDPGFQLRFRYPAVIPQGHVVDIEKNRNDDSTRVHISSRDSQEVYFEVQRHLDLAPLAEYQRPRAYLEKHFELDGFTITALADSSTGSSAAQQYSFQCDRKQRVAILIQHVPSTYRIIYDLVSPLNAQILSTLELILD